MPVAASAPNLDIGDGFAGRQRRRKPHHSLVDPDQVPASRRTASTSATLIWSAKHEVRPSLVSVQEWTDAWSDKRVVQTKSLTFQDRFEPWGLLALRPQPVLASQERAFGPAVWRAGSL